MKDLFTTLVSMSITASILTAVVILLRLVLKRAPKKITCALWILVAIRLVIPFSVESPLGIVPHTDGFVKELVASSEDEMPSSPETPQNFDSSTEAPGGVGEEVIRKNEAANGTASSPSGVRSGKPDVTSVCAAIWAVGAASMFIYMALSYLKIRRAVREAVRVGENVYICDRVPGPFIIGILRPKIYLPSSISRGDARLVLAHERAHIKRLDYLWKPLGFVLLSVYWFNPVMWIAYILLCRDIELACDERVISEMGSDVKRAYSSALVNCSMKRRLISSCPLAFGENGVKSRVKNVLNYKKPAFWIVAVSIVLCAVAAVCLLTNRPSGTPKDAKSTEIESDSGDEIDYESEIAGKRFYRQLGGFGGEFGININKSHTFTYYEGPLSSHFGSGTWELDGNTLKLYEGDKTFYFTVENGELVFDQDRSSRFIYVAVKNGDRFTAEPSVTDTESTSDAEETGISDPPETDVTPADTEAPHTHSYVKEVASYPTCTDAGKNVFICEGCGNSYTEDVPPLGHSFIPATCLEPETCERCGYKPSLELAPHAVSAGLCPVCGKVVPLYRITDIEGTDRYIDDFWIEQYNPDSGAYDVKYSGKYVIKNCSVVYRDGDGRPEIHYTIDASLIDFDYDAYKLYYVIVLTDDETGEEFVSTFFTMIPRENRVVEETFPINFDPFYKEKCSMSARFDSYFDHYKK